MYKVSCRPDTILYIAENKRLAGREHREHEDEALGRKMAIVFYENLPGGLVQRVHRETLGMQQNPLTIAELLQTLGGQLQRQRSCLRQSMQSWISFASHVQSSLKILMCMCTSWRTRSMPR